MSFFLKFPVGFSYIRLIGFLSRNQSRQSFSLRVYLISTNDALEVSADIHRALPLLNTNEPITVRFRVSGLQIRIRQTLRFIFLILPSNQIDAEPDWTRSKTFILNSIWTRERIRLGLSVFRTVNEHLLM